MCCSCLFVCQSACVCRAASMRTRVCSTCVTPHRCHQGRPASSPSRQGRSRILNRHGDDSPCRHHGQTLRSQTGLTRTRMRSNLRGKSTTPGGRPAAALAGRHPRGGRGAFGLDCGAVCGGMRADGCGGSVWVETRSVRHVTGER